jgi:arginine/lysine/ornithine decarboxylase
MPTAEEVIKALENEGKDIGALILTHPSYKGVVTDIQAVVEYCAQRQIQFIVDEAHGTHFPFLSPQLNSVLVAGGDLVLHSLHKYVGGFVQTALMHLPANSSITVEEVKTALGLFESTTRSNLLMLSIEESIKAAFTEEGQSSFIKTAQRADKLRQQIQSFGQALIADSQVCDPFKFFLKSDRVSGEKLGQLLNQYGIDYEYADEQGVLLIFSFQHTEFDFKYTGQVLEEIHQLIAPKVQCIAGEDWDWDINRNPIIKMLPKDAFFAKRKQVPITQAQGEISATCLKKVPPGIPILIPGEEVTEWHLNQIAPETVIEVITQ